MIWKWAIVTMTAATGEHLYPHLHRWHDDDCEMVVTADNIHIGVVCELKCITILTIAIVAVEGTVVTMMTLSALVLVFLFLFHIVVWKVRMMRDREGSRVEFQCMMEEVQVQVETDFDWQEVMLASAFEFEMSCTTAADSL